MASQTASRALVDAVATAAETLQGTSQEMSQTAESTTTQAASVASYAEQSAHNVQTVAAAAEQLNCSIREIARQVEQAATITTEAVLEAERSNTLITGLAGQANKIGEIIQLINDIASQTARATQQIAQRIADVQGAATGEIARNVQEVASGTQDVTSIFATGDDRADLRLFPDPGGRRKGFVRRSLFTASMQRPHESGHKGPAHR